MKIQAASVVLATLHSTQYLAVCSELFVLLNF